MGNATMLMEPRFEYKVFSAAEIRVATDGFSDHMRLKSGGDWTDVSKAKLHHISVAIKLYSSADVDSEDTFNAKVKLLSHMRHPHLLSMIGYCSELRTPFSSNKSDIRSDIQAYGNLVLQILTGRNWAGIVEEAIMMDRTKLIAVLDPLAGEWQLDVALELGRIGIKCLFVHEDKELNMTNLARELEKVKKLADEIVANGECVVANGRHVDDKEDSAEFPNFFLCPIFQHESCFILHAYYGMENEGKELKRK
ncbi:hypothetical protein RND71_014905 [Anisodus tanguticus]|uniref:RING-type E3 ubiquitin transferase n=1 Tax=Anisodus tanguticus TaxID=243964 RepID=A0AAE1SC47_9SOLA|nr:hypothetical protein RND71_014905 [Anisodus tanguticus]